jgi:hypothetical protein
MSLSTAWTLALHKAVDVQVLNIAPLSCQHSVLQGRLITCRDDIALTDFIERVSTEHMEFEYHQREYLKAVLMS